MAKEKDLTGRTFGHLTVLERTENHRERTCWLCRCDCGNETDVTESGLVHGNYRGCGCLKIENQKNISKQLHMVDGTCVEMLERRKYRRDNTSGFRGVYQLKNRKYRVDIGFKGKRFYIGCFEDYNDAVQARLKAEEMIHEGFLSAYHNWRENEEKDPMWGKEHPLVFEVYKENGKLTVRSET